MVENITVKKIQSITDEIKELHPLLETLFKNMDEISNVENTHGNREFGADFVLEKKDNLLDSVDYVGVIAKRERIVQNDSTVLRQIDECLQMPRVILGKKKITLNEIWVITCGNISTNAKDFFAEKYATAKLKFIDGSHLAKLTESLIPNYWKNISLGASQYLTKTKEYLHTIEKNSSFSAANLEGYELEQDLIKIEKNTYRKEGALRRAPTRTHIYKILGKKRVSLLEGPMGSGKSSLLRKVAIKYCNTDLFAEEKTLPIYLCFKDFKEGHNLDLKKLIEHTNSLNKIDEKEINYLILLDGIDETMLSVSERLDIINKITKVADSSENIKVVMAGREMDDKTFRANLPQSIQTYKLAPLTLKTIISLIERACSNLNVSKRIAKDLNKSNLFKMLPKTPIAAVLLARLLQENHQELPSNLTELYSKYTEISLGRWDIEKGIKSQKEYDATHKIVIEIAKYTIDNDLPCLSIDEAKSFFSQYLNKRNLGLDSENLFNSLIERSDLVALNEEKSTFQFRHRTFTEYFFAEGLVARPQEVNETSFDVYWATINFFWVGLMRDCPDILSKFTAVSSVDDRTKILKLFNMGNILLAGYQTPYEVIEESVKSVFLEAGKYFCDLRGGIIDSPIRKFSEMQTLCLFRYIMTDGYGFEFFKPAIESALINIEDDKSLPISEKATALFLLNTVYLTLGGENIFEGMVRSIGGDLPLSIQLGMRHESIENKLSGGAISKIHRNIEKLLKSRTIKQDLEILYERPLEKLSKNKNNKLSKEAR